MTHQHTEAKIISLKKTRNPHRTQLHVCRNSRVPRNPCWRAL